MQTNTVEVAEIPAALPGVEADDDATRETLREKSLEEFTAAEKTKQMPAESEATKEPPESDGEAEDTEDEDFATEAKPSKKKLFFAFVAFLCCFVLLVVLMCWFFGIGFFSAAKTSRIDRTGKPATVAATDEEKLKMALNIVADKSISANSPAPSADSDSSVNTESSPGNSSVTVPSAEQRASDLAAPIIVPDGITAQNRNPATGTIDSSAATRVEPISNPAKEAKNNRSNNDENNRARYGEGNDTSAVGRSLFFGTERKAGIAPVLTNTNNRLTISNENRYAAQVSTAAIPFGTLLPVRLLGAIYTLRASGGLVRMELTRPINGKNFAYPAGTILVGTLRGSEYKRAFVSVVGLIDPASGALVKFTGEAMGGDGASGFVGRRRKVKGAWSRVLAGLRESAAVAVSAIGNRRSGGGTIVISDSTAKASGALSDEFSALVGGGSGRKSDEFVEVAAGTNAYVLVTDLPDEISGVDTLAQNSNNLAKSFSNRPNLETGLTDEETANLFAAGSPERLRAALPRMTPRFRQLAEQALATMEN